MCTHDKMSEWPRAGRLAAGGSPMLWIIPGSRNQAAFILLYYDSFDLKKNMKGRDGIENLDDLYIDAYVYA